MSVDAGGVLWLADPVVAAATLVAVTGLLLWCHRLLAGDADAGPVPVPVRVEESDSRAAPTAVYGDHHDTRHWPAA